MEATCICPVAGYCERYKREMGFRPHQICQGTSGLSPEKEAKHRDNWAKLAKSTISTTNPQVKQPPPIPCQHLGPEIRREQCQSCGGKVLVKVMSCPIHIECQGQSKKIKGVASCCGCPDYQPNGAIE